MPTPPERPRHWRPALLSAGLALLAGCSTLDLHGGKAATNPAAAVAMDRETTVALMLANTVQTLQRLSQASASEQAEILSAAKQSYEKTPFGSAELRYALALAIPGTPNRDPDQARSLMRELAAQPESLAPVERALLLIELAHVERELGLSSDNQRLQTEAQRSDRDRQAVANRRLQAEIEENAKLRKQLEEAVAKLDAIAQMERNLSDRPTKTEGRKP
jgi:hypothetical protein